MNKKKCNYSIFFTKINTKINFYSKNKQTVKTEVVLGKKYIPILKELRKKMRIVL